MAKPRDYIGPLVIVWKTSNRSNAQTKIKKTFEIQGVKFGFINELEDISFGEYIDLESNIIDVQSFHKAMAVMYRPITSQKGDKYTIEKYSGTANYADLMKYAPLDVVLPASVFFWSLGNELLTAKQAAHVFPAWQ